MADKKITSRILREMSETMRGLDRCEQKSTSQPGELKKDVEGKAQQAKGGGEIRADKSQASK